MVNLSQPAAVGSTLAAIEQRSLSAAAEILGTVARFAQWSTSAWNEIKSRYRGSVLSGLCSVSVQRCYPSGILYGALFGNDLSQYLPFSPPA
jgi:hypothetical protein